MDWTRKAGVVTATAWSTKRQERGVKEMEQKDLRLNTDAPPRVGFAAGADDLGPVHLH